MFYHSVDSFGDLVKSFPDRKSALDSFFKGDVKNVYNTYQTGYHRQLTQSVYENNGYRKPTMAECIARDVV